MRLLLTQKRILITLIIISWLLFGVMLLSFDEAQKTPHIVTLKTVDMIYKALESFIFQGIAGVFLF
jgi:hypothetical protein